MLVFIEHRTRRLYVGEVTATHRRVDGTAGGTLRRELLDRTLIWNQAHLRAVLAEYQEHYNTARSPPGHWPAYPQR